MNFNKLKQLTPNERTAILADNFYTKHGKGRIMALAEELGFEISEMEVKALIEVMIGFSIAQDMCKFREPPHLNINPDLKNYGEEVIHVFKRYLPFVFGYNDGSRNHTGLFPVIRRHFAGGMDPVTIYLATFDLEDKSFGELVAEIDATVGETVDAEKVRNRIRNHF